MTGDPDDAVHPLVPHAGVDNVGLVRQDVAAGRHVAVDDGTIPALADLPAGHKVAVRKILAGEPVLKYGEIIGVDAERDRVMAELPGRRQRRAGVPGQPRVRAGEGRQLSQRPRLRLLFLHVDRLSADRLALAGGCDIRADHARRAARAHAAALLPRAGADAVITTHMDYVERLPARGTPPSSLTFSPT